MHNTLLLMCSNLFLHFYPGQVTGLAMGLAGKELPVSATARTKCTLWNPRKEDVKAGWPIAVSEMSYWHRLFSPFSGPKDPVLSFLLNS